MNLADYVKSLRVKRGYTLSYVCSRIGISISHLHDIENGNQKRPKLDVLRSISDFYNVDEDNLISLAQKIPRDVYWKIVNNPQLIQMIRECDVSKLREERL